MQTLRAAHDSRLGRGSSSSSRPHTSTAHVFGITSVCSAASRQPRHAALLLPQAQQLLPSRPAQQRCSRLPARAEPEGEHDVVYNKEFGYSRKDVLIIIVALIGAGVLMYEGLQAAGMSAGMAGNWVQLTIFLGICVGWVSTYIWRVANKVRRLLGSCGCRLWNLAAARLLALHNASDWPCCRGCRLLGKLAGTAGRHAGLVGPAVSCWALLTTGCCDEF
eukprot:GHRQ01038252.1.p1 GENE.GHRQ01038252.1~~GHRQ01038252.1.p1  ORF type:complete len:220 (+),score=66.33 GHRQ01038252.1:313-972(+)